MNSNPERVSRPPHKIIILNGPRYSGKDYLAAIARRYFHCRHYKFSRPLKDAVRAMFALTASEDYLERIKTEPQVKLLGKTYVWWQIALSERFLKREISETVFGDIAVSRLRDVTDTPFTIVSDCGFEAELAPVVREYGAENVYVIRVRRDGSSFGRDAREWGDVRHELDPSEPALKGVSFSTFDNNLPSVKLTEHQFIQAIQDIVKVQPDKAKPELTADDINQLLRCANRSTETESN